MSFSSTEHPPDTKGHSPTPHHAQAAAARISSSSAAACRSVVAVEEWTKALRWGGGELDVAAVGIGPSAK
jgi:hypothetical protein